MDYSSQVYPVSIDVMITIKACLPALHDIGWSDSIKGLNKGHALWRAKMNWPLAKSIQIITKGRIHA